MKPVVFAAGALVAALALGGCQPPGSPRSPSPSSAASGIIADAGVISDDVAAIVSQIRATCPSDTTTASKQQLSAVAAVATDLVNDTADFQAVHTDDPNGGLVGQAGDLASTAIAVSHEARDDGGSCARLRTLAEQGDQLVAQLAVRG